MRRDGNEALKDDEKKKEISEDDRKRGEDEVQKLTDRIIKAIDEELARKEKDILSAVNAPAADIGRGRAKASARHVAIIMDGNGRWAKKRHLPRVVGHQKRR